MSLDSCYYHVTYEFQSESTVYSLPECQGTPYLKQAPYLKFLSESNEIGTHIQLVRKWILNQLGKLAFKVSLANWLSAYELSGCGLESRWILNRIPRGSDSATDFSSSKDVESIAISWINHKSSKCKTKCLNGKACKVQTDTDLQFTLYKGRNSCSSTCCSSTILKGQNHPMQVERGKKDFVDNKIYLLSN